MTRLQAGSSLLQISTQIPLLRFESGSQDNCRLKKPLKTPPFTSPRCFNKESLSSKRISSRRPLTCCARMVSPSPGVGNSKLVWMWTEKKEVMTAAVERGWSTFVFTEESRHLANDWSSIARINPLFVKDGELIDQEGRRVAKFSVISSPEQLDQLLLTDSNSMSDNVVIDFVDWQVIPAENIVAAFQSSKGTVFAVSKSASEAQIFLEALEQGLGGVVLKVDNLAEVLNLKEYLDRRIEVCNSLTFVKATVTQVHTVGMGDRACVDLCSLMKPGEGLLVGSFARGLFLVHSECLESNYISSRPFRVNAGPVHSYVAVPGGKTSYLSELKSGKEVIVVDQNGHQRTATVGRVKIESRPMILVEAKTDLSDQTVYSILLQNAETVALVAPSTGCQNSTAIPVTSLKVGDEVLLSLQGEARHTGIEIKEFIVEK